MGGHGVPRQQTSVPAREPAQSRLPAQPGDAGAMSASDVQRRDLSHRAGSPVSDFVTAKLLRTLLRPGTARRLIELLARGEPRPIVSVMAPPATKRVRGFRTWTSIVVSSLPVSVTLRRRRSPESSATIRKPGSGSRPASTWGRIRRPGRVPSCSPYGCSSPTCSRPRSRSCPSPCFTLATAPFVSLSVTFVLLGVGRSIIGRRRLLPTVVETIGIAAAAACAGLSVGKLIS